MKKPPLAAPHDEPLPQPLPFFVSMAPHPPQPPCASGHHCLRCRPPQRLSPIGTPPLKLAFSTSPVLCRLGESHRPHLADGLATQRRCSFHRLHATSVVGASTASEPLRRPAHVRCAVTAPAPLPLAWAGLARPNSSLGRASTRRPHAKWKPITIHLISIFRKHI